MPLALSDAAANAAADKKANDSALDYNPKVCNPVFVLLDRGRLPEAYRRWSRMRPAGGICTPHPGGAAKPSAGTTTGRPCVRAGRGED